MRNDLLPYKSPTMDISLVELEQGIATGSATVVPTDSNGVVHEEWKIDSDDNRTINW
ncbi:hypothetical protein [Sphingobacterium hungaricum]|uniref:hypothetical protein n=1 Tax=Sphingobacterium hungaricum TaxID=2082723 RepID=UPI0018C9B722|nr:hypothetical protein [Sphingobacterium hungaricum]